MPDEGKYPSNSYVSTSLDQGGNPKGKPPEPKKIVKGEVKTHKKSLGQKMVDFLFAEDIGRAAEHVIYDVLIPNVKDILYDSVAVILFGGRQRRPTNYRNDGRGGYVSYSDGSNAQRSRPVNPLPRNLTDNIYFDNPEDAHDVLESMREYLRQFNVVTVGYMYGLLGYPSDQTKENYGWYNIDDATVAFTNNGYTLRLPRPILLQR